jgi:hypothetical protein
MLSELQTDMRAGSRASPLAERHAGECRAMKTRDLPELASA